MMSCRRACYTRALVSNQRCVAHLRKSIDSNRAHGRGMPTCGATFLWKPHAAQAVNEEGTIASGTRMRWMHQRDVDSLRRGKHTSAPHGLRRTEPNTTVACRCARTPHSPAPATVAHFPCYMKQTIDDSFRSAVLPLKCAPATYQQQHLRPAITALQATL